MARMDRTVKIVYKGRSRYILNWFIKTLLLSLITLGFYLPVGVNRLLRYLCHQTEFHIYDLEDS